MERTKEREFASPGSVVCWEPPFVGESQQVRCELVLDDDPRVSPLLVMQVGSVQLQMGLSAEALRSLGRWILDFSAEIA